MEVKCLESNEAWGLFRDKVGRNTLESQPDILERARQVARKCRGLPLALIIIGKNMASKRTVQEWDEAIRHSCFFCRTISWMKRDVSCKLVLVYPKYQSENGIVRRMSLMENEIENISDSPECPELTTLLFQNNGMGNISGEFFKSMPSLVVLDLSERRTPSRNKSPTTSGFPNLSIVNLSDCDGLKDVTWLLYAPNLTVLKVISSSQIEDIISKEKAENIFTEEEVGTIIPFQRLEHLKVENLPKLKSIYWSPLPFPRLSKFSIRSCPNLRKLPLDSKNGGSNPGEDLVIYGEQSWVNKVEWEDEATKERFLPSLQATEWSESISERTS
ncbi:unnamed protein product [Microthlaspi erraticum]|uniref:Disease resistance protein At4g27190-like leucine-rich repeats domain-containing protein n=1 Tax=Microthlaspi erraticum TaxID=1685480 RepID=A0A6D2IVH3_9BRAS|nr:unnamed protein product [Microthlaspi erraticum]